MGFKDLKSNSSGSGFLGLTQMQDSIPESGTQTHCKLWLCGKSTGCPSDVGNSFQSANFQFPMCTAIPQLHFFIKTFWLLPPVAVATHFHPLQIFHCAGSFKKSDKHVHDIRLKRWCKSLFMFTSNDIIVGLFFLKTLTSALFLSLSLKH